LVPRPLSRDRAQAGPGAGGPVRGGGAPAVRRGRLREGGGRGRRGREAARHLQPRGVHAPLSAPALAAAAVVGAVPWAVAARAGFGIGSLLTPLLALWAGTKLAVALVSIPHVTGTALRFWMMRRHVARRLLLGFGLTSAAGGLAGALLHGAAGGNVLTGVL